MIFRVSCHVFCKRICKRWPGRVPGQAHRGGCPGGPGLRPGRGGELPEVGSAGRRGAGRPAWRALTSDGALRRGMPGDACSGDRRQRQGACALQLARQADVAGPCGRLGPETPAGGRREQAPPRRGVLPGDGGQDGRLESARERPGAAATGLSASASASGAGPAAVTEGECPPDTVAMRRAPADYAHPYRVPSSRLVGYRSASSVAGADSRRCRYLPAGWGTSAGRRARRCCSGHRQPRHAVTAAAARRTVASAHRAPMICRPTGRPERPGPMGTETAGRPARLAGRASAHHAS
jgi:hypothetical protein